MKKILFANGNYNDIPLVEAAHRSEEIGGRLGQITGWAQVEGERGQGAVRLRPEAEPGFSGPRRLRIQPDGGPRRVMRGEQTG